VLETIKIRSYLLRNDNSQHYIGLSQTCDILLMSTRELYDILIIHGESKKSATLTMAITLSILGGFVNSFTAAKISKFPTKTILDYPPHLKYVAALPWKT